MNIVLVWVVAGILLVLAVLAVAILLVVNRRRSGVDDVASTPSATSASPTVVTQPATQSDIKPAAAIPAQTATEPVGPVADAAPPVTEPVGPVADAAPPITDAAPPVIAPAADVEPQSAVPADAEPADDLRKIEGIGPKMAVALQSAGIRTYRQLADSDEESLRAAVRAAGMRAVASLPAWPERAKALVKDPTEETAP